MHLGPLLGKRGIRNQVKHEHYAGAAQVLDAIRDRLNSFSAHKIEKNKKH